jgi:hypothetical protein
MILVSLVVRGAQVEEVEELVWMASVVVHSWGRKEHPRKPVFRIGHKMTFALTSANYCLYARISHFPCRLLLHGVRLTLTAQRLSKL